MSNTPAPHTNSQPASCVVIEGLGLKKASDASNSFDLILSLNFELSWVCIFGINVRYGLSYAELQFDFQNYEMPLENRRFKNTLKSQVALQREVKHSASFEDKVGEKQNLSGKVGALVDIAISNESTYGNTSAGSVTESNAISVEESQISTSGQKHSPSWHFRTSFVSPFLKGGLFNESLGVGKAIDFPVTLESHVRIAPSDVYFDAADILEQKIVDNPVSDNKKSIARNLIFLFGIKNLYGKNNSFTYVLESETQYE